MVKRIPPEERGTPDLTFRFKHDVRAPGQVRNMLKPALLSDVNDPIADDVLTVASELVTNVIVHTDHGGELAAWDPKPHVPFRIEITDSDPRSPEPPAIATEHGGRGIRIVDELSDAWGVSTHEHGKTVWAEFQRAEVDE